MSCTLRTRVAVHIVARYDVDAHIRSRNIGLSSSRCRDGGFAAAVVEQVDICIAKMSICDAVDDVVKAGFRQAHPGRVIKHFVADVLRRCRHRNGECDAKWQPEQHECEEAVKVASHKREIRFVHGIWLKTRLTHELLRVNYNANVNEERNQQW